MIQLRATPTERRRLLQPLWNALDSHVDAARGALLAVSGGPDSRALLEAVARWPRRFDGAIHVASVDHRTRSESAAEADAVVARARVLGFEGVVLHVHAMSSGVGGGEAPLREARYAALFAYAREHGLDVVVTAHHEGDVAEGALLTWLGRGGGALAHAGVARPFASLARVDLRLALAACGVDDSFADPDATSARSRLRRSLLAPLSSSRGDIEARIARAASLAHDDDEALRALAAPLVSGRRIERPEPARLPILRRALRLAVAAAGSADPRSSSAAVEIAARLMRDKRAGHVDCAGCFVDVGSDGTAFVTARVADGAPPTHDGRAGPRLSAARPMRMVRE